MKGPAWAADGATALAGWSATEDGSKLAYAIQDGGSDWRTIRVMDVATGAEANVSGGFQNDAQGPRSSISGGKNNVTVGADASISGGDSNTASVDSSIVVGDTGRVYVDNTLIH